MLSGECGIMVKFFCSLFLILIFSAVIFIVDALTHQARLEVKARWRAEQQAEEQADAAAEPEPEATEERDRPRARLRLIGRKD